MAGGRKWNRVKTINLPESGGKEKKILLLIT